jgi:hypothetical protein
MKSIFTVILFTLMVQLSVLATGSVTLAWNAITVTNSGVIGYNVYWGGSSGNYTNQVNVPGINTTNVTISGLTQGTTYYFAATSYTSAGMESPFSSEVSYLVPANILPPAPTGLHVIK